MKLSTWAKQNGIAYGTALRWFHKKLLPVTSNQLSTGTILVDPSQNCKEKELKTFIYSRVSTYTKKDDLSRQAELCQKFCINKGWKIEKTIKEISSGMNDNRPKLSDLLDIDNIRIVCLHKDRLTRFGFKYIEKCIKSRGGEIVIINAECNDESDLLKDFIAIITSFCCRLYGARRGQRKATLIKKELKDTIEREDNDKID